MSYEIKGSLAATVVVSREPDRSGNLVCDGTADDVEIQAALDYLTAGRDWYEKVLLKGDFTISTTVHVPSYTILEIDGKCTLADTVNLSMFDNNEASATLPSHIVFTGGILDGNRANNVGGTQFQALIDSGFATKITIKQKH